MNEYEREERTTEAIIYPTYEELLNEPEKYDNADVSFEGVITDVINQKDDLGFQFELAVEGDKERSIYFWSLDFFEEYKFYNKGQNISVKGTSGGIVDLKNGDKPIVYFSLDDIKKIEKKYEYVEIETETETETETTSEYSSIAPGEKYFEYSGSGDDVVKGLKTIDGEFSYANITHEGDGFFSVEAHHGDTYDLLVNTTEPYDGRTLLYPDTEYVFVVNGEGDWNIWVQRCLSSSSDEFSGSGDYVTPIFLGTSDTYEITTKGDGHFAVTGYSSNGKELLVNTTDQDYSGKIYFNIKDDGAFFEINAEREWEIKPVK